MIIYNHYIISLSIVIMMRLAIFSYMIIYTIYNYKYYTIYSIQNF